MVGVSVAVGLLAIGLLAALPVRGETITVLFTNDLHARIGRLAAVGRAIDFVRTDAENVLLVDAGDTWHDFRIPVLAGWGGGDVVRWMNSTGYDAMALGNHEFAIGARELTELVAEAEFPVLSANTAVLGGLTKPFEDSVRLAVGSQAVLLVGLTTSEFFPSGMIPWMRIEPPSTVLDRVVATKDREDPRLLIVVLAHFGVPEAIALAQSAPWIDLIVTGHTHTPTPSPVWIGRTMIVQGSPFAHELGRVDLSFDDQGELTDWRAERIEVDGPALGGGAADGWMRLAAVCILSAISISIWVWGSGSDG